MIRKALSTLALSLTLTAGMAQTSQEPAKVYFTSDISPESLVSIFKSLGVAPEGNVAVKISTGESAQSNHLRPELIGNLVKEVKGTIVECNTAYGGSRSNTASHRRAIEQRGYGDIAIVDIMDEEGGMSLPMQDTKWFSENLVGSHLANYDFMINLAHFKGHAMGGFGGVLKIRVSASLPPMARPVFTQPAHTPTHVMCFSSPTGRMPFWSLWRAPHSRYIIISKGKKELSI